MNKENCGTIHSIETFGTVDGPGIRFVIFMQGCTMQCAYCHNRDTWSLDGGTQKTADELLAEFNRYRPFLTGGGITVSGGEPLLQINFLIELFEKAHLLGIHTCLDTAGGPVNLADPHFSSSLDRLISSTDLVLLDIKHIDPIEHKKLTGMDNRHILDFARYLSQKGIPTRIRQVLVPSITLLDEQLYRLGLFCGELTGLDGLELLPYHWMGKEKWEKCGEHYPLEGMREPTAAETTRARLVILKGMQDFKRSTLPQ